MEAINTSVVSVTTNLHTTILLDDGQQIEMCGTIVDGHLDYDDVGPPYYNTRKFNSLTEIQSGEIRQVAYQEFKKLI